MELLIVLKVIIFCSLNHLAKQFPDSHYMRCLGIYCYIEYPYEVIRVNSFKLLLESFFDMAIAVTLTLIAIIESDDRSAFFTGFGNVLNSVLTIIYIITMIGFLIYSHFMVHIHYDDMDRKEIRDLIEPFTDGSSKRTYHSTMVNIYFTWRRLFTVI